MNLAELTLNNAADLTVLYASIGSVNAAFHAVGAARAAFRLHPELREPMHIQDDECTVDPATDLCVYCGVMHGEPCAFCGGRGFHRDDCGMEAAEAHEEILAGLASEVPHSRIRQANGMPVQWTYNGDGTMAGR